MPTIDDSIRKIDNVICRHLDEIEDTSRGAISQDILEQLTKFVNHIMLKFYANGRDIAISEENIAKAVEFAQVNSDLHTLYKFRNYLNVNCLNVIYTHVELCNFMNFIFYDIHSGA